MGDPSKFRNIGLYYFFNTAIILLILSELLIFIYTFNKGDRSNRNRKDKGTKWLLYLNFSLCIYSSFYFVSRQSPGRLKHFMLPTLASSSCLYR